MTTLGYVFEYLLKRLKIIFGILLLICVAFSQSIFVSNSSGLKLARKAAKCSLLSEIH